MLDNLTEFTKAIQDNWQELGDHDPTLLGDMYCSTCSGVRRMVGVSLYSKAVRLYGQIGVRVDDQAFSDNVAPTLFRLTCSQCDSEFTVLIYQGVEGLAIGIFSNRAGGASTPNTPPPVAYYLDQANRAQSVGADSAAVAMYRGALDQILHHEGFKAGMLGKKLGELERAIASGTAPKWAMELETEYLAVLNQLGSGSIHPNDGDITKQQLLDNELLTQMQVTFSGLLYLIYELPHARQQHLRDLKSRAQLLRK